LNNYLPFISNNTNSNFVCGTFGYDEKYISSLQSSLTINFLQDISNAYYGQPYLFVSAGSRGSGYMYLDWIIVTYGVPYVISLS